MTKRATYTFTRLLQAMVEHRSERNKNIRKPPKLSKEEQAISNITKLVDAPFVLRERKDQREKHKTAKTVFLFIAHQGISQLAAWEKLLSIRDNELPFGVVIFSHARTITTFQWRSLDPFVIRSTYLRNVSYGDIMHAEIALFAEALEWYPSMTQAFLISGISFLIQ